jgi:hypothetical protein
MTYSELYTFLYCGDKSKDMIFCSRVNSFEHCQIRDYTTGVKVLESIETQVFTMICNIQIVIPRIHSTYTISNDTLTYR